MDGRAAVRSAARPFSSRHPLRLQAPTIVRQPHTLIHRETPSGGGAAVGRRHAGRERVTRGSGCHLRDVDRPSSRYHPRTYDPAIRVRSGRRLHAKAAPPTSPAPLVATSAGGWPFAAAAAAARTNLVNACTGRAIAGSVCGAGDGTPSKAAGGCTRAGSSSRPAPSRRLHHTAPKCA